MQKTLLSLVVIALAFTAGCTKPREARKKKPINTTPVVASDSNHAPGPAAEEFGGATVDDSYPSVADEIDRANQVQIGEVPLDEPSPDEAVLVAAAVFPPRAKPGDVVTLVVRFRTALGWYFYAMDDQNAEGPITPTSVEVVLPKGFLAQSDWELPQPRIYDGPDAPGRVYGDDVTFRRRIKIDGDHAKGIVTLPCLIDYQSSGDPASVHPQPKILRPTVEVVGG